MEGPKKLIQFQVGTRTLRGHARRLVKREVFDVELQSIVFGWLFAMLPLSLATLLESLVPAEWRLPKRLILKLPKKPKEKHDRQLIERESIVYARLRQLQGWRIPKCFGLAVHDEMPALLLSLIPGRPLYTLSLSELVRPERVEQYREIHSYNYKEMHQYIEPKLLEALEAAYADLTRLDVVHGDPMLNNFFYDNGAIIPIDFEYAEIEDKTVTNEAELWSLCKEIDLQAWALFKESKSLPGSTGLHFLSLLYVEQWPT